MKLPTQVELITAALRRNSRFVISQYFGQDWYKKGDPRQLLQLTYNDFREWALLHGIPGSTLIEGTWGGHEHYVISEHEPEWWVGYAERGEATLVSKHPTLSDAREAVLKDLWELYESAGNPSHWVGGVPAGSPYA